MMIIDRSSRITTTKFVPFFFCSTQTASHMSWTFLETVVNYLDEASQCTQELLPTLFDGLWTGELGALPHPLLLEMLRGPIQEVVEPQQLFAVRNRNALFVNVLGEDVWSVEELLLLLFKHLQQPQQQHAGSSRRPICWCVVDARTEECWATLVFHSTSGSSSYEICGLFVEREQLLRPPPYLHEILLVLLTAFADRRGAQIVLPVPKPLSGLMALTCACLLFMRDQDLPEGSVLVRLPLSEVVYSHRLLMAAQRQVRVALQSRCSDKTGLGC